MEPCISKMMCNILCSSQLEIALGDFTLVTCCFLLKNPCMLGEDCFSRKNWAISDLGKQKINFKSAFIKGVYYFPRRYHPPNCFCLFDPYIKILYHDQSHASPINFTLTHHSIKVHRECQERSFIQQSLPGSSGRDPFGSFIHDLFMGDVPW